jgi:hypothetical protein
MAYEDLLKDTSIATDSGNYFLLTITDLQLNTTYPLQFRWKYKDGSYGLWSGSKTILTPGETLPGTPNLGSSDVVGDKGLIKITWDGKDSAGRPVTNIDRIDIYIDGAPFDGTKPAGTFKAAGTQTIAAPAGDYTVVLYAISNYGSKSAVSAARTVTVTSPSQTILSPEDPYAPTVTAGLASVIVEWNGKKSDGQGGYTDFTTGSFAGAKVFIGTTSDFTPSDNNWVHTLNFANGTNKVSIGVGTVINKSTSATLQYGTPYYIKIDTINASGVANGQPVSAGGNPITVSRLPASEIEAGILRADAYIQAGANGGQRAVLSGGLSPFIIYGTDGTTKLLEYLTSGTTGTLAIKGSGTFTGTLAIGTEDAVFKAEPETGIWLGDADYADADFRVATNGVLRARAGTIGGWVLGNTFLQNTAETFKISSQDSAIFLGNTSGNNIRITPDQIAHYNGGSQSGKFTLTTSTGNLSLSGTITGSSIVGSSIQQGSSGNYLLMDQTNKATIKFYTTGYTVPGSISTEGYATAFGNMVITPPTNGLEDNPAVIQMYTVNGANTTSMSLSADEIDISSYSEFLIIQQGNGIQIQNDIDPYGGNITWSVRNVWTAPTSSVSTPVGTSYGTAGDLWFVY